MNTANGISTGEELARHARWIRRLASALLRDEAAAEDLVQDAWLAALTRPPSEGRLRPWLREVARNLARRQHRGNARRSAREESARAPSQPEAPDAFAERVETEQRLTRALAALAEPFRTTLMLRYYEELEPAEIAARLGLPGGTVRWRLARGLELLRERLDRAHGGDRRAWSLALAPLARMDGAAGASTVTSVSVLPGLLAMNLLKVCVAVAVTALLVLGLSLAGVLPDSLSLLARRETPLAVGFRPLELERAAEPANLAEVRALEPQRVEIAAAVESAPTAAATAREATLDVRIFGQGRALAGARLVVRPGDQRIEVSAGTDGLASAAFALAEPRALVGVELHAFGFATRTSEAVCEAGRATHLGRIELVPGGAVSGRVVDERGVGLADCRVTLGSLEDPFPQLEAARLEPARDAALHTTSDADGGFRLLGVPAGMARLWGHAPARRASYTPPLEVRAGQESTGVELVLAPLAPENRLRVLVLDPTGQPVPGARLEFRHLLDGGDNVRSGQQKADADGRFEFLLPADARTSLTASDPQARFGPATLADIANGERELVLTLRDVRRVELALESRGAAWLGPCALELWSADGDARLGGLALGKEELERAKPADAPIAFVLPDESFVLRVFATGHRMCELGPLDPARVGAALHCTLEPVPGLAGIVSSGGAPAAGVRVTLREAVAPDTKLEARGYRLRLWPEIRDEVRTDAQGRFLLTPRVAGSYFVRAEPADAAPAELGPIEVDERLGGPPLALQLGTGGAIEGRVRLARGADPEGAIVGITRGDGDERTQRVGSDGAFRFEKLVPGPWRVELCTAEAFGPPKGYSAIQAPGVKPFELAENCTVYEGETSFVDVSDGKLGALAFEGRLEIDGRPAVGWTARLCPAGTLEFEGQGWTALDSDGSFTLSASAPGKYRVMLRRPGGESQEQFVYEDVLVRGLDPRWEREFSTGQLVLAGVEGFRGEGTPRVAHCWSGPGRLRSLAVVTGDGEQAIEVPAGAAELRAPSDSSDPESWKLLRAIEVRRGETLRVELTAAERGAR
ncbi:MAG: sigma-70 family RNA polymerase sigma factor [Planctomycetota bacterium]|nr:MAG: sigma-70 family RNA polymerase sigma factor [Planctomycetota bacterium]